MPANQVASVPVGQPFSRVYLAPATALPDSAKFRTRLAANAKSSVNDLDGFCTYLRMQAGLSYQRMTFVSQVSAAPIADVLDVVTFVWRYLKIQSQLGEHRSFWNGKARDWLVTVGQILTEEKLAYRVDDACGVHRLVDVPFEAVRQLALLGLEGPRYASVVAAFELAHERLGAGQPNTKEAVRSAFESLEILVRLMVPSARNLSQRMIESSLKPIILAAVSQPVDRMMIEQLLASLAEFVNSVHNYRHGQPFETPMEPSIDLAIYVVATVGNTLRWLVPFDPGA